MTHGSHIHANPAMEAAAESLIVVDGEVMAGVDHRAMGPVTRGNAEGREAVERQVDLEELLDTHIVWVRMRLARAVMAVMGRQAHLVSMERADMAVG